MSAVLSHQYAMCSNASCFIYSLIIIKPNLNDSHARPLSTVEPSWSYATRVLTDGTRNSKWILARRRHAPDRAPFVLIHLLAPSNPLFSQSALPIINPTAIRNFNTNPCPLLASPSSRHTPDSLQGFSNHSRVF